MPIIDVDIHNALAARKDLMPYLPAYWREKVRRGEFPVPGGPYQSPIGVQRADATPPGGGPAGSDPAHVMNHHMDPNGITYGILTSSGLVSLALWPDVDFGSAVCSAYNDFLVEKWLGFSDRFRGSILVNHGDPAAAAKEIDRVAPDSRFVQVIMASGARTLFGNRFYHPIYEAAERHGLPVAFHPGSEGCGIAGPTTASGYPSIYFEHHNILPANYMAHINSLVCEGVFEKFPKLTVIAIEGGIAWLPHLMWRMDKNWKALRATTPWLKRLPSEYIIDHVRLTTQPIEEPPQRGWLQEIFDMVSAEKTVMFSSDYPHWDNDDPVVALRDVSEEMRARIYHETASELYDLPVHIDVGAEVAHA